MPGRSGIELPPLAPGDPYFDFFERHASGPVPLFEVDDVHAARKELEGGRHRDRRAGRP